MDNFNTIVTILSIIVTSVSIILVVHAQAFKVFVCGIVLALLVIFISIQRPPQPPSIHIDQIEITILNGQNDNHNMGIKQ